MKRISIEVTEQEQQRLKAMASLQGKSIKEFVLSSTIGTGDEAKALEELEALLDARMQRARKEGFSAKTVDEIFEDGIAEAGPSPNG
ncbi:MAG: antitoxin [bacterium]|nr:antitoxin [bacterium]